MYLAREVHLDRLVAIKLLPPALAVRPALRDGFLREARMAAKLSHPNIIPIHAVRETDGFVYYVMAYVDGETLAQRVQSRGPLSTSDAIGVLRDTAWALGYAHTQGLVHRDVKPDNILIESATGRALVADFGIAAAAGGGNVDHAIDSADHNTTANSSGVFGNIIAGTPGFMSPEQAIGGNVDSRSDIYSLGATAYYALTCRCPFDGASGAEIVARQVTENARPVSTTGIAVPRKIAALIDRCLSRDPAARPASAAHFAEQLAETLEQRRELPAALRAFVKRNGRMDGAGTLLTLTGALVGAVVIAAISGPAAGVIMLVTTVATAPLAFGVSAAGRLAKLGFVQADLDSAFSAERESIREERSAQPGRVRTLIESTLRGLARATASTSSVLLALSLFSVNTPRFGSIGFLALTGFAVAGISAIGYVALLQTRRDVDVEFWNAAWTGPFGRFAFSIARRFKGASRISPAMTHRATELSLGLAAEDLFESLPKAIRESLGDVPSVLQRLQSDARKLRLGYNELNDALGDVDNVSENAGTAQLVCTRTKIEDQLRTTVGALETIRLDLLRLHTGSITLEGFVTNIDMAREMSGDARRLLAAQHEVEAMLGSHAEILLTPV